MPTAAPALLLPEPVARPGVDVAVVVLSWNARTDVLECLSALDACRSDSMAVVLVDNASADGTLTAVRELHPWVEAIDAGANLGFAGGNNVGMRRALELGARTVLLLNSDARIDGSALNALLAHLDAHAGVGAVQPLLLRMDDPARIDSAGQWLSRRGSARESCSGGDVAAFPPEPRAIFGACAAAVLLRTDALREVGYFDGDLFTLFEDVDLSFRLRAAGWDVHLLPCARVVHRRGISRAQTVARDPRTRRLRQFWLLRNSVALALRYTPISRLPAALPRLTANAILALWLRARLRGQRVLPLWWSFLRRRAASRRGMRRHRVDRFFGQPDVALVRQP
ncbi:MAG: glycosyltransferase family 2 protein [Planctomycetota bacterium]